MGTKIWREESDRIDADVGLCNEYKHLSRSKEKEERDEREE